jgi:hypothetical protein
MPRMLAAAVAALALLAVPGRAEAPQKITGRDVAAALAARMPESMRQSRTPGTAAAQSSHVYYILQFGPDSLFVDLDGDGQFSLGETIVASGRMFSRDNRLIGTWEGTVVYSSRATDFFNLTLRFPRRGTATLNGAAYRDGIEWDVAAVPWVGRTGVVPFRGTAGLEYELDDQDVLHLIVYPQVR